MTSQAPRTAEAALPPPAHPPSGGLTVVGVRAGEQHVLILVGEADLGTAQQLRDRLLAAVALRPPSLLVHLAGLDFCDLAGLDALHGAVRQAEAAGVPVAFRGMSPQLAWLHQTFPPRPPGPPRPPAGPSGPATGAPGTAGVGARADGAPAIGCPPRDHAPPGLPRAAAVAQGYAAGYSARRTGTAAEPRHAVPPSDTTRSGVCGARVRRAATKPWDTDDPTACPDCAAALAPSA